MICSILDEETSILTHVNENVKNYDLQGFQNIECTIPATYSHNNELYKITTIDNMAFNDLKITQVNFAIDSYVTDIPQILFASSTSIKSIIFPRSLIKIHKMAFNKCIELENIEFLIGCELKTIGKSAFQGCKTISKIKFPKSLLEIKDSAFSFCSSLKEIEFEENSQLVKLGSEIFMGTAINSLVLPSSLTKIRKDSFHGLRSCNTILLENEMFEVDEHNVLYRKNPKTVIFVPVSTQNYVIPNDTIEIGPYSFEYCEQIQNIIIPASIQKIRCYAFSRCIKLENILFDQDSNLTRIGTKAFEFNNEIRSIYFPKSLKIIGKSAFYTCISLNIAEFPVDSQLEVIKESAFESTILQKICIPKTTKIIENKCFANSMLLSMNLSEDSELEIIGNEALESTHIIKLFIPAKVKRMSLIGMNQLNKVKIAEENKFFKTLQDQVVYSSKSVIFAPKIKKRVLIRESVEQIHEFAFQSCYLMTIVCIPSSCRIISKFSFKDCESLRIVKFIDDSHLKVIGESAFIGCNKLRTIRFPKSLEEICEKAFSKIHLKTIIFHEETPKLTIKELAFDECMIKSIDFPFKVLNLETRCFLLSDLKNIHFNEKGIELNIGHEAFKLCRSLVGLKFPACTNTIGTSAFSSCKGLQYIHFDPNAICKVIDKSAFLACESLREICFHRKLELIESRAFYKCVNLERIEFPERSKLKKIISFAFEDCHSLKTFSCPRKLNEIWKRVFYKCPLTEFIIPEGSQLKVIGVSSLSFSEIVSLKLPGLMILYPETFSYCSKLKTIIFSQDSTFGSIERNTFYKCSSLERIEFPSSLQFIRSNAFAGLTKPLELVFPSDSPLTSVSQNSIPSNLKIYVFGPEKVRELILNSYEQNINRPKARGCSNDRPIINFNDH